MRDERWTDEKYVTRWWWEWNWKSLGFGFHYAFEGGHFVSLFLGPFSGCWSRAEVLL